MGNKLQAVDHAWNSSQDMGNSLPLYIFSSNFRASGRRRSPLLLGKPVPRQTGQTSFPRPEPSCVTFYSMSLNLKFNKVVNPFNNKKGGHVLKFMHEVDFPEQNEAGK